MLTDFLEEFSAADAPEIFAEVGTEFVRVMSTSKTADEWGGEGPETLSESIDIPGVLTPRKTNTTRTTLGSEYLDAQILLPAQWPAGTAIVIKASDKLKVRSRPGANPERIFQIKTLYNNHGVFYDIGVTEDK